MEYVWTVKRPATGKNEKARQMKVIAESLKSLEKYIIIGKRFFEANKIEILSTEKIAIIIFGQKKSMEGHCLTSVNPARVNRLNITIQRGKVSQNLDDPKKLLIRGGGMISIAGEKIYDPQNNDQLHRLPFQHKFLSILDGMEWQQSGTLRVEIKAEAAIILS